VRIQNEHDDPDGGNADLLQKSHGGTIEMRLTHHDTAHGESQRPRQQ